MDGYHMCAIHLQFLPLFWASLSRCPPLQLIGKNWHEWLPFQSVAVQAVNLHNEWTTIFTIPLLFFSPSQPFLIEGELGSKNLISEK